MTSVELKIPGYEIMEKLGQGSMGTVFKARQLSMDRLVAIKILKPKLAENPAFLKQFVREAHLAAKLSSNNVVQAIDVGSAGDVHYFVMEYVEGTTIKDELEKGKIFKETEAVDIILHIARALQNAYTRNLIHRDIKPANIMLTRDGVAKLADLGLARATTDEAAAKTEKGKIIGTPSYISPEQIKGREDIDSRADMYALGATLYHMVTGRPPFSYAKVSEVLKAHLTEELTPPDHINQKLSAGLGEVCELMMAKKRSSRYASPEGLIIDLECLLRGESPRVARQKIGAAALRELAKGEEDDETEGLDNGEGDDSDKWENVPIWWVYALGAALGVSVVLNLLLVITR